MDRWLVVGLGNPGPTYERNRHNVGAMVAAELAERGHATLSRHKGRALVASVRLGTSPSGAPGPAAVVARPLSFMNESGGPVKALLGWFDVPIERLVVVHDDLDLPFATLRLKRGGGEGGHNGLKSISRALASRDYLRVRIGIGRPPGSMGPADYVLRDFAAAERPELPFLVPAAADAVEDLVIQGLEPTQQRVHSP